LASQLEALRRAECHKIFQEQISTRVKVRPELEKALALAHQFKEAAPETPVIFTVHELKRLARNAAELMTLSADLQAGGIQLELLTGPLTGIYNPTAWRHVLRRARRRRSDRAQLHPGEDPRRPGRRRLQGPPRRTAQGHRRRHAHLRRRAEGHGRPRPGDREEAHIKTGKNAGTSPSVASLYRALAEAEQAAADDGLPLRPRPARIRRPEYPLIPEEIDLRQRLQSQPHPNTQGATRG